MIPPRLTRLAFGAILIPSLFCTLAAGHGTHEERVKRYIEEVKRDPRDANAWHELALARLDNDEWQLALQELDVAQSLVKPAAAVDFSVTRARAMAAGRRLAGARELLDAFLKKSPRDGRALLERARILDALKMPDESLADYRLAMDLLAEPAPEIFIEAAEKLTARNQHEEALALILRAIGGRGETHPLLFQAMELEIATGRVDDALARVDRLEKAAPRPEPWMAKRAMLLTRAGRDAESREAWTALANRLAGLPNLERGSREMTALAEQAERALAGPAGEASKPGAATPAQRDSSTALHFPLRRTFADGNNHEEELESLDRAIEQTPQDAALWFQRAHLLSLDAKWSEARADCDEADRLAPGKHATDRVRGQILMGEDRLDESKALLDRFLLGHPNDGLACAARARVLLKLGHAEAALADFREALARVPVSDSNLYREAATALAANGHPAEAREVLTAGLVKFPGLPSMELQALDLEIASRDFDAALLRVAALQQAAPLPEPWMARGAELLDQAGRKDEARSAWIALRDRIAARPNLERGAPHFRALAEKANQALTSR